MRKIWFKFTIPHHTDKGNGKTNCGYYAILQIDNILLLKFSRDRNYFTENLKPGSVGLNYKMGRVIICGFEADQVVFTKILSHQNFFTNFENGNIIIFKRNIKINGEQITV